MLLELQNVSKSFSRNGHQVQALQDVSFRSEPSQFVAVRGPSGCGKTTLLLVSGGLLRPDAGEVSLSGHERYTLSPENRAGIRSAHIGFVFQQFHLIPYLNVVDNVLASSLGLVMENASERRELYDRAIELVERFGLMDRSKHLTSELSTGQRQRVALARALFNRPKLLLADEPTGNLDKENSVIVWQYLREFAAEDRAVLMVTHDSVAAERADRVIEMEAPREIS